ncbi:MAG: helix-turn-helix domain-containing protein, partial [Alphaproteobacteria bacterium]|nr:helix-turn-helix domain-containing protein [Alphaproteobacteria bacterium]
MDRVVGRTGAGAGVLERCARIVELLGSSPDPLSLTEVADFLNLPKATVHRLLKALVGVGWAEREGRPRAAYRIGRRLTTVLTAGSDDALLALCAEPILTTLVDRLNETCFLARLAGQAVHVVTFRAPRRGLRGTVEPGTVMPGHAAASAKAIIAYQDRAVIERVLRRPLRRYTARTITDDAALLSAYAEVRAAGEALCLGEIESDVAAFAVPVRTGRSVYFSIAVTGPHELLGAADHAAVIDAMRSGAHALAEELHRRLRRRGGEL